MAKPAKPSKQLPEQIKRLLKEAPFSFVGTVTHLGATMTPELPVDNRTAVVTVVHVLHAPDVLAHHAGQSVTLQLSPSAVVPAVGETLAFFTDGLSFGQHVALREVGRLPAETVAEHAHAALAAGRTAGAFAAIQQEMRDDALRERMKDADVVVTGHVVATARAAELSTREHDPDWWAASLQIDHVGRGPAKGGPASGDTVQVLYPASMDVRWHHVPKPRAGQSGVWILHATSGKEKHLAPYVLQHQDDFQESHKLDLLK